MWKVILKAFTGIGRGSHTVRLSLGWRGSALYNGEGACTGGPGPCTAEARDLYSEGQG